MGRCPVKPPSLEYVSPRSLDEALAVLAENGDEARVLAGGQSLVALLNLRLARPRVVVDIRRIDELHAIAERSGQVCVGAAVTQAQLAAHPASTGVALLDEAIPHIAHQEIRNAGTVVGSLAHGDPAGELPTVAVALDAQLELRSVRGSRTVSARDFYTGYLSTQIAEDELIVEARFPVQAAGSVSAFAELAPRQGDYALAGVGVALTIADGHVAAADIGLLALGPTPLRARASERLLGLAVEELPVGEVAEAIASDLSPKDDLHASAGYRRYLASVLTERTLRTAQGRIATAAPTP